VLELSQKRDIAVKQCPQKLAGPRVGQLAVGIELLVRVCHQHFGSEKNVGIGGREYLTKLNLAAHRAGQAGRSADDGGDGAFQRLAKIADVDVLADPVRASGELT
jgi:hypothetical protein